MPFQRFVVRQSFVFGNCLQLLQLRLAEHPLRLVDYPFKVFVVVKRNEPQICNAVAYFHSVVEPQASVKLIRYRRGGQSLLGETGEKSRTVEYRNVAATAALILHETLYLGGYPFSLVLFTF